MRYRCLRPRGFERRNKLVDIRATGFAMRDASADHRRPFELSRRDPGPPGRQYAIGNRLYVEGAGRRDQAEHRDGRGIDDMPPKLNEFVTQQCGTVDQCYMRERT